MSTDPGGGLIEDLRYVIIDRMEKWIISTNHAEEQSSVSSLGVPVQEITFQSPEIEKGVDSNMHLI